MLGEYVDALVKLAWLYVLRNDPRSKAVLDRAESLRAHIAQCGRGRSRCLEQTWGEYWRRAGDLRRALEHKHRALHLTSAWATEQIDSEDLQQPQPDLQRREGLRPRDRLLAACAGAWPAALAVEPEILAAHSPEPRRRLLLAGRVRSGDRALPAGAGDQPACQLERRWSGARTTTWPRPTTSASRRWTAREDEAPGRPPHRRRAGRLARRAATRRGPRPRRKLKSEILGPRERRRSTTACCRSEFAAHFSEMSEVQRQRAVLAVPLACAATQSRRTWPSRTPTSPIAVEGARGRAGADRQARPRRALRTRSSTQLRSTFYARAHARAAPGGAVAQRSGRPAAPDGAPRGAASTCCEDGSVNKSGYAQLCERRARHGLEAPGPRSPNAACWCRRARARARAINCLK